MSFKPLSPREAYQILGAPGGKFESAGRRWKHQPATLREIFLAGQLYPDREFLVFNETRIRYGVFGKATLALAQKLAASGLKKGDLVAFSLPNSPEWVVLFFAVNLIGAVAVPLNAFWTESEEALALAQVRPALKISAANLREWLAEPAEWSAISQQVFPQGRLDPEDPAAVFFTSGSTGRPKPVVCSHRNITASVMTESFIQVCEHLLRTGEMPAKDAEPGVTLLGVPLFHVAGCCAILIPQLYAGNKIVLLSKWNAEAALRLIEKEKVHFTGGVSAVVWQLLNHPRAGDYDLSSLKMLSYGGAPSDENVNTQTKLRGLLTGHGWGMTETAGTFMGVIGKTQLERPGTCGLPLPVALVKISEQGELWVQGPQVVDSECDRDGWLKTGDLARVDEEGYYYITGRLKDLIVRNGEKISPYEIETLLREHPAVLDAAAFGVSHPSLGEEVAAVVETKAGLQVSQGELETLLARLAVYKRPSQLTFATLPRTATGKVDKNQLKNSFQRKYDDV